jgi:hypothetical protein
VSPKNLEIPIYGDWSDQKTLRKGIIDQIHKFVCIYANFW